MKADVQVRPKTNISIEELIGLRLFSGADVETVYEALRNCAVHLLAKDEILLVPGTTNNMLYLLLNGRLRVHLDAPNTDPIYEVDAGETVGEMSAIDEKPASAYVVADTQSEVLEIDQESFWRLVDTSHAVARNMLALVVERMRSNNDLVAQGMMWRKKHRFETNIDELTGLRNARALTDLLRRQLLRSSMNRSPLTLMMVEIDGYAEFCREFGSDAGDHAIHAVAHTLQGQVRPTDMVARMIAEKYAIVLPDCNQKDVAIVAERVRAAVSESVIVLPDESIVPPVTISIGVVEAQRFHKAEDLLQAADEALLRAKNNGGNTFSS